VAFGWNTPDSRKYNEEFHAKGLKIAQDVGRRDGKLSRHVERYIPGLPTQEQILKCEPRVEADAGGRLWISPGPGRRDDLRSSNAEVERFNHIHMFMSTRCVRFSGYVTHLGATNPARCGGAPRSTGHWDCSSCTGRDMAVVRQVRWFCSRAVRERHVRRHQHFDPAVAWRRTRQHTRASR